MILSYLRAVVLYLLLIAAIRLMGKRQVGELEPAEFVVTMLVANLASIPMQDGGIPLYSGAVPILTVLGLELVLSWVMLRLPALRRLLCGKPVVLIDDGRILQSSLRRTRITLDELIGHLREKDVLDLRTVQYAVMETNGTLSVFPYPNRTAAPGLPVTLVEDGAVQWENLRLAGRDAAWLLEELGSRNARVEDTFLLSLTGQDDLLWIGKEGC